MVVTTPPASEMRSDPTATPGRMGSYCQNASMFPAATSSMGNVEGTVARTRKAASSMVVMEDPIRL